jgi:hypothetical protein
MADFAAKRVEAKTTKELTSAVEAAVAKGSAIGKPDGSAQDIALNLDGLQTVGGIPAPDAPISSAEPAISASIEVHNLDGEALTVTTDQLMDLLEKQQTHIREVRDGAWKRGACPFTVKVEKGVAYLKHQSPKNPDLVLRSDGFIYQVDEKARDAGRPIAKIISVAGKLMFAPPNLESYQYSLPPTSRWIENTLQAIGIWFRKQCGISSPDAEPSVIGQCDFTIMEAKVACWTYTSTVEILNPQPVKCSCMLLSDGQLQVSKEGKPRGQTAIISSDGYWGDWREFSNYVYPLWPFRLKGDVFICDRS